MYLNNYIIWATFSLEIIICIATYSQKNRFAPAQAQA